MKAKWEKVCKQLTKLENSLTEFLNNGGLSSSALSKSKSFVKDWNSLKKEMSELDSFFLPVDPCEIKFPFRSAELTDMWDRWKNYLREQHGQSIGTYSEQCALEHLNDLCKGDEERAVKFLRYAMTNRYRNFFAVEDKDTKQPAKNETGTGSDF